MKPCPFCGETRYLQTGEWSDEGAKDERWIVRCEVCAAEGPINKDSADQAVKKWNERKPPGSIADPKPEDPPPAAAGLPVTGALRVNVYTVLSRAVEEGVALGWQRARKHTEKPSADGTKQAIEDAVMNQIAEVFTFDDPT